MPDQSQILEKEQTPEKAVSGIPVSYSINEIPNLTILN
jgi:hypothetical protein